MITEISLKITCISIAQALQFKFSDKIYLVGILAFEALHLYKLNIWLPFCELHNHSWFVSQVFSKLHKQDILFGVFVFFLSTYVMQPDLL